MIHKVWSIQLWSVLNNFIVDVISTFIFYIKIFIKLILSYAWELGSLNF